MTISIFDLFSIGIGPSSSHTVGPMKAANQFVTTLNTAQILPEVTRIQIELFGSLAFTGKGHGTDHAILLGLEGALPSTVNPDSISPRAIEITKMQTLSLLNTRDIHFDYASDFIFNYKELLPFHTNAMRFKAFDANLNSLQSQIYYSIGGGFIVTEEEAAHPKKIQTNDVPYPFENAKTLLAHCESLNFNIEEVIFANECTWRSPNEIKETLFHIAKIMRECIDKGCHSPGILPGGLDIKRRAPVLYKKILAKGMPRSHAETDSTEWLNLYAIAVNEENAAGGRVVTAPTNGAAGVIPAVLHYYLTFYPCASISE